MKAILPGSYDPITLGHLEIIRLAAKKYDEVFVTAFINPDKKYLNTYHNVGFLCAPSGSLPQWSHLKAKRKLHRLLVQKIVRYILYCSK